MKVWTFAALAALLAVTACSGEQAPAGLPETRRRKVAMLRRPAAPTRFDFPLYQGEPLFPRKISARRWTRHR